MLDLETIAAAIAFMKVTETISTKDFNISVIHSKIVILAAS